MMRMNMAKPVSYQNMNAGMKHDIGDDLNKATKAI
jgi:hypothetical protein